MSAWILAVVLSVPASAQVVETVRVAPPSAAGAAGAVAGAAATIPMVPQASALAPSLGLGATLSAPQPRVHFAPPVADLRSDVVEAAPRAEPVPGRAAARKDFVPPSIQEAGRAVPSAASFQGQESVGVIPESASVQSEAQARIPVEGASAVGRRVWDRSSEHASLGDVSPVPTVSPVVAPSVRGRVFAAAPEARAGRSQSVAVPAFETEALRDAVASPMTSPMASPVAAAPAVFAAAPFLPQGGAPVMPSPRRQVPSLPTSLDRLWLELASGLVVKVRAALGWLPASATALWMPRASDASRVVPVTGAPMTSTEWLERRGLFETLSAVESVAGDVFAAPLAAISDRDASASPAAPAAPVAPSRSKPYSPIFWGLAFLPVAVAFLREFL
ncbi:MAG: hypothetical protein AAB262_09705 [Elusimicrobiota bacterium]